MARESHSNASHKHHGGGGGGSEEQRQLDELAALNELIRNITQLTGKSIDKPMKTTTTTPLEDSSTPAATSPPPTTTTTRVIADETDKQAIRPTSSALHSAAWMRGIHRHHQATATERPSTSSLSASTTSTASSPPSTSLSGTTAALLTAERFLLLGDDDDDVTRSPAADNRRRPSQSQSTVHTTVDKDNKRIAVVYAETVTPSMTTAENTVYDAVASESTAQPFFTTSASATLQQEVASNGINEQEDSSSSSSLPESPPTPPEATTPLIPAHIRPRDEHQRRRLQKIVLKQHLEQRNSLLRVLNATSITASGSPSNATESGLNLSQRELARVADALKALRTLAAPSNKCNVTGSISKCALHRSRPVLDNRRNRVENVLAKTHEEVAARTREQQQLQRLRKLRVCVLHVCL